MVYWVSFECGDILFFDFFLETLLSAIGSRERNEKKIIRKKKKFVRLGKEWFFVVSLTRMIINRNLSTFPYPHHHKIKYVSLFFFSFEKIVSLGKGARMMMLCCLDSAILSSFFPWPVQNGESIGFRTQRLKQSIRKKTHRHAHTHSKKTKEEWVSEGGEVRRVE